MASHFDEFDKRKLDEIYDGFQLLVKQNTQLQLRIDRLIKLKANHVWGRKYLRRIIMGLREKVSEQKGYIGQLENELRLRGLE